jgi:hypothetical protein
MGLGHSPSVVQSGLAVCLDPGNTKSYSGSGSTITDISGSGNNFTLNGSPYVNYGYGTGLTYSGAQTLSSSFTPSNTWSISMWFNNTSTYNIHNRGLFSTYSTSSFNGCYVGTTTVAANSMRVWYNSNGYSLINYSFNVNSWYHLTITCDGTTLIVYVNGVAVNSITTATTHANTLAIGQTRFDNNYWIGNIGQTLVYSRALTSAEVLQNYSATRGRFDNFYPIPIDTTSLVLNLDAGNPSSYSGSGTTWTSLTGTNNATLQNGPTFDTANGGTIAFDGTNDYASCASSSDFAFGTGDFTLEMWIKHGTSGSAYQHLFALPDQSTFGLKAWDQGSYGELYFYSSTFDTYTVIPTSTSSGWVLDRNVWNHIVFTRASSVAYGYKNGILKGSKSSFNNNFSSQTLNIGWGYGSEYRSKNIAVARIWKRALSQAEITSSFNALRGRFGL